MTTRRSFLGAVAGGAAAARAFRGVTHAAVGAKATPASASASATGARKWLSTE